MPPDPNQLPRILDESRIGVYRADGYLCVEQLLSDAEIDSLRNDVVRFARGDYPIGNWQTLPHDADDRSALQRLSRVFSPQAVSPTALELARHPSICGVISQLIASRRPDRDGSAKFVQSTMYVKPPGMPGHAWHQDDRSIQTWDQSVTAAWIPLDEAGPENGGLRVIPGSHRSGYLFPLRPHHDPATYIQQNEAYGFDESAAVDLRLAAGDVLFFSGSLLHGSLPNRTGEFRRAIVNHYASVWTELPWFDVEARALRSDLRTVLPVAGRDPYAWKGYETWGDRVYVEYSTQARRTL